MAAPDRAPIRHAADAAQNVRGAPPSVTLTRDTFPRKRGKGYFF